MTILDYASFIAMATGIVFTVLALYINDWSIEDTMFEPEERR